MATALACKSTDDAPPPTYTTGVQALLEARCLRCHADPAPAGGWSASSYVEAIGCSADGTPVTRPSDGEAPRLIAALGRSDHAGLLDARERDVLSAWVAAGTPRTLGGVHPASFADPRSPDSHDAFLRARHYKPMTDPADADACGACHDGASVRPVGIFQGAPNAPACTSCHTEPGGSLACGTCHGSGSRAYPPRDRCFFPGDADDHAHAAHASETATHAPGLACSTCHPVPASGSFEGVHANGWTDVWFDFAVAGRTARFDANERRCTGTCHARGGARPAPTWGEAAMTCNDCHTSPPANHYEGACTMCHHDANADGTALTSPALHVNGKVDLGDGSGRCGACHGTGDDPWPSTGAHRAHAAPGSARPVACETCHDVPAAAGSGTGHPVGRGSVAVRLAGLAVRGGRRATWDPDTKTCAGTYCHESAGGSEVAPRWTDTAPRTCSSCHSAPPPPPHVQSASCGGTTCHEGRTNGLSITEAGRADHVNGTIDRVAP